MGYLVCCACVIVFDLVIQYYVVFHVLILLAFVRWGEQGYIRVEMGKDMCGIAQEATTSHAA